MKRKGAASGDKIGKKRSPDFRFLNQNAFEVLERVSDAFVSLDKNWCYVYVSKMAGELMGRNPQELIGKHVWTEFPEGIGKPFHLAYEKAMQEQVFQYIEEYYPPYDKWFENRIYPSTEGLSIFFHDITDRKKLESKLIQSEDKFNKAFRNSPDALLIINVSDEIIIEVNQSFVDMFGYSQDEIVKQTMAKLWLNPEVRKSFNHLLAKNRSVKDFEADIVSKYGKVRHCQISGEIFESQGKEVIIGILRDVTEQKLILMELRNSKSFVESIVNASPDLIDIYDIQERRSVFVNKGIQEILGYSETEIYNLGSDLTLSLMHPDDFKNYVDNVVPRYFHAGANEIIEHEYRMKKATGEWRWLRSKETIFDRDDKGIPKQIFGMTHDITEKKIKDQILLSDRQILEMVSVGMPLKETLRQITLNLEGIMQGALCSILLLDKNGKNVSIGAAPSLPDAYNNAIEGMLIGPNAGSCGTAAFLKKTVIVTDIENDPLWTEYRDLALHFGLRSCWSVPVFHRNGSVLGTFAMYYKNCRAPDSFELDLIKMASNLTAISLQRSIEEKELLDINQNLEFQVIQRTLELNIEKEKAQSADRLKSAFLASMSHELRTPLNSIIGFTGILLNGRPGPLTPEQEKQLKIVQVSSQHLLYLINDVLDISKIEANQLKIVKEHFELSDLIYSVVESLKPQITKKFLVLETIFSQKANMIFSDKIRIRQILINILNNSVKFTDKGGIILNCYHDNNRIAIQITDTGIGIPKDKIEFLFRPFKHFESGIARRREGTGLGLYICKKLLDMLGGTILIESIPGQGTSVIVTLPSAPESADM